MPEFNPQNIIQIRPGTPLDAYFEGALKDHGIQYFRSQDDSLDDYSIYATDNYYFSDEDFEHAKAIYEKINQMLISEKANSALQAPVVVVDEIKAKGYSAVLWIIVAALIGSAVAIYFML